jgi:2'-5' RNA ligase
MTRQNQKSPPYTLAFRIPADFRKFISACNRKLKEICRSFEPPAMWHLTVKFLGHSSEHLNDETILTRLPEIYEVAKKYMPLAIYVRGFSTFSYKGNQNSVIFLRVMPNQQLINLHNEICEVFSDDFQVFPHADHDNYEPHITLSKDLYDNKTALIEKTVARSKKMAKRRLKLDDLVVMSPNRLFPVTDDLSEPFICPPVK